MRRLLKKARRTAERHASGFTLIEVLVSIVLLALISTMLWQAMGTSAGSKERFEKQDELFHAASLALDRMTRDLQSAAVYGTVDFLGVSASGEQSTKPVFIGENIGDQDRLTFFSFCNIRHLKGSRESDQAEVSYFLETDPDQTGTWVLKKRTHSPPDARPDEGGEPLTLLEGVTEFNLRFYDDRRQEYVEAWDSTGVDHVNRLPRVVEVVLGVKDPFDEEWVHRFMTVAWLEMAPGPNDF